MHALRRNAGQTAAEYMGVLLVVSVIVAAVATSSIGITIGREASRLVCTIGGGSDCGTVAAEQVRPQQKAYDDQHGDRHVYDADNTTDLPGDLARENGDGPTGDAETDAAFDNFGKIYDYFNDTFGRNSYDDAGADLMATIRWRQEAGKPLHNAFWDGTQMKFGEDFASPLDITAHELTHAITDRESGLKYELESGALNESLSDIFASNVDGNWEIGEDLPGGAFRDMAHPEDHGQPGNTADWAVMDNDDDHDHGGVHTNSGIPNKAYVNMVDALGRDASQHIVYDAATKYLDSDSGFEDFRTACLRAAEDRYGSDSTEYKRVDESFAAVGLDGTWVRPNR